MKIYQQSPQLAASFRSTVKEKVSQKRQKVTDTIGNPFMGMIADAFLQIEDMGNSIKGNLGERLTSTLLMSFPDSWVMFRNALIPVGTNKLTEIDLLIIGTNGIFLTEVKTWKGSFSAYRDRWKRREGAKWIPLDNSPTSQSNYHQKAFQKWLTPQFSQLPQNCIIAPVVFPVAKWIGVKECCVPVCHGIKELSALLYQSPACLSISQVLSISNLVANISPSS